MSDQVIIDHNEDVAEAQQLQQEVPLTRAEQIARLHDDDEDNPMFLPTEFIYSNVLPGIVYSFVALTILFACSFLLVDKLVDKSTSTQTNRRKVCYQMTNFAANCFLGLTGAYYELFLIQSDVHYYNVSPADSTSGYNNAVLFSSFQIGFQLWSIPIGLFLVDESLPMLVHHLAVICVSTMSGFLRLGFRYWTPFFYGFIELSSVPLAIMNTFKDNPKWIQQHKQLYTVVRVVFGISFLWIRIVMFTPRMYLYLYDHYVLFTTSKFKHYNIQYQVFMSFVWISAAFLQVLQFYWGYLIVKGLYKIAAGDKENANATKSNKKKEQ